MDLAIERTFKAMGMSIDPEIKEQISQESAELARKLELEGLEEEMSHDECDSRRI